MLRDNKYQTGESIMKYTKKSIIFFSLSTLFYTFLESSDVERRLLYEQYHLHCVQSSDINEHIPLLRRIASECSSVVEIGIRHVVSTWGILLGLAESTQPSRSYLGIDMADPYPAEKFTLARHLTEAQGISFTYWKANDMDIDIPEVDMLFIDSLHTYCHLTYELEKFCGNVKKYIAMHDTSEPWGNLDADDYHGNYTEYPAHYNRTKRGLWPAVEDFLRNHPEWRLHERRFNNHGFTILKRVSN